jgi:hypothetical protein
MNLQHYVTTDNIAITDASPGRSLLVHRMDSLKRLTTANKQVPGRDAHDLELQKKPKRRLHQNLKNLNKEPDRTCHPMRRSGHSVLENKARRRHSFAYSVTHDRNFLP